MSTTTILSPVKTIQGDPVQAEFLYWAANRENDPAEIFDMVNGKCDAMKWMTLPVHNVRTASLADITHESHGFQIVQHDSQFLQRYRIDTGFDFSDFTSNSSDYCLEIVELVKKELSCQSVVVNGVVFRESSSEAHSQTNARGPGPGNLAPPNKPFHIVHNDFSAPGARATLRAILPTFFEDSATTESTSQQERDNFFRLRREIIASEDEAVAEVGASSYLAWNGTNYAGRRWAAFSIWRPIEPVCRDPLAVLDPNSLFGTTGHHDAEYKAYVHGQFPPRNRPGLQHDYPYSNMMPLLPRNQEEHKWLWLKDQQPNEVNFLKLFDSEAWKAGSRVMPCAPHSAFSLPGSADSAALPRRSIETRVLVIW